MANSALHSDALPEAQEAPDANDVEAVVEFYERTGAMPLNSIGPPIDRPIIPARRPDRVGDFAFTTGGPAPTVTSSAAQTEDPEAEQLRKDFLVMLNEELKGL